MFYFKFNRVKVSKVRTLPPPCSVERLRELLHYNKETGVFTYNRSVKGTVFKKGDIAGFKHKKGYMHIIISGKTYKQHKLAWYYITSEWIQIDHKDTVKCNNAFNNLRPATDYENARNRKARINQKYLKGVSKDGNKFMARILINNKRLNLGTYNTPELAHIAYCKAAEKHHKEFARF